MRSAVSFRLVAVALFGLAVLLPPLTATFSAVGGMLLLMMSVAGPTVRLGSKTVALIVSGLAALILLVGLRRGALGYPEPAGWTPAILAVTTLVMALLVAIARPASARLAVAIGVLAFLVVPIEVMSTFGGNLYGLDVYRSHEAAADAMRLGENPYTDAMTVADGSPNAAPGDVIEGYSYPPVTLFGYVMGDLAAGDPRWTSGAAILAVIGILAWLSRVEPVVGAAALVLLLAVPLQRAIVWSGWTEPLSLCLLAGGVVLWRREWLSPVLLGLALASKQYLVVLLPVLVLIDSRPWRRSIVSLGIAALTLVPAVVADFPSFWFTMVTRPLGLGFRPDTRSLSGALAEVGVHLEVPSWLMLASVVLLGIWLAKRIETRSDLLAAIAAVLGATFVLSMAFINYWWLVQWTAALAAVTAVSDDSPISIRSDASPSA